MVKNTKGMFGLMVVSGVEPRKGMEWIKKVIPLFGFYKKMEGMAPHGSFSVVFFFFPPKFGV